METVNAAVKTFDTTVSSTLKTIEQPIIVRALVTFFLMLYAARIAPAPPQVILDLFGNFYFKLFIFTLILWTAQLSPSTAILIALCFLITINYSNSGKLFESLENTPVTPEESVKAVVALADAAAQPVAIDAAVVQKVAEIAVANVQTAEGAAAVQALAEQAVTPVAGVPEKVEAATQKAVESIPVPKVEAAPVAPVESEVEVAPVAVAVAEPEPVAEVEAAPAAVASEPAPAPPVAAAPVETGCYPVRNYDMSKVQPHIEGQTSFEDLASFEL
jgi:hypothetical protein